MVDGLLGTGLTRPVEGPLRAAIEAINRSGKPVLALDLPSGLDADRGEPLGAAVRARVTATFVAPKLGFSAPGASGYTGEVCVVGIGVPAEAPRSVPGVTAIDRPIDDRRQGRRACAVDDSRSLFLSSATAAFEPLDDLGDLAGRGRRGAARPTRDFGRGRRGAGRLERGAAGGPEGQADGAAVGAEPAEEVEGDLGVGRGAVEAVGQVERGADGLAVEARRRGRPPSGRRARPGVSARTRPRTAPSGSPGVTAGADRSIVTPR